MYYQLSGKQEQFLLAQPETGMGYQLITAKLGETGVTGKFIVLNAELAVEFNEAAPLYVKEIARDGIERMKTKALPFRWEIISVLSHDTELKPTEPVQDMKPEYSDGGEIFVRRSVYENDKRIDPINRNLRAGSFTTTLPDSIKYRHTSEDPLIQLAMDHGVRGKWGYYVQPKRTDALQRGVRNPHTGAKEVFFKEGTSFGTFLKRETY